MANALFALGRKHFLDKDIDLLVDVISIILVDHADDTPVAATDDDMADIVAAAQVPGFASGPALGTKDTTAGTFDAADTTFTALSGDTSESLVVFLDTGTDTTSLLIVFIDVATGLPITPNAGDITVQWDSGADKIFTI